jgi:aminoglycoside phosphotransferase (APT) family kinase protein
MGLEHQGDDAALVDGLTGWLAHRFGLHHPSLSGLHRPSAGYSSETVMLDAEWGADGCRQHGPLVVRMAPVVAATFPRYDLRAQWQAQTAAAAAGVPVADPVLEEDAGWLGAPFMVMPNVDGHIIGALAHRDRWLRDKTGDERRRLHEGFVTTLDTVHRADPALAPDVPRRDNGAELDFWADYLDWSSGGSPVAGLVDALAWCRANRPANEPAPVLLWGDVRFENTVVGDDLTIRAVLDWDMTSVGAPEHDLAWFTSLDLTTHHLFGERPEGFPDRSGTIARFEEVSGRPVSDLDWYETLAMVRSTAIMTRIGYLRRDAGEPLFMAIDDNPLLDLLAGRLR